MTTQSIEKTIFLKAAPELVWDYLTQPDKLAIWFHAPKAPLEEGGKLELFGATSGNMVIWGKVLQARAPKRLVYTFTVGPMGDAQSTVTWTLEAVAGGTRLHLSHIGLPEEEDSFGLMMALDEGWDEHMGKMRTDINGTGT